MFERQSDLKELKEYLASLKGRNVLALEETTTARWLYLELVDHVDRLVICDPFRNRLLSDCPKTDKIDAGKLCLLLRAGLLKEVFHSSNDLYELRRFVSAYEDLSLFIVPRGISSNDLAVSLMTSLKLRLHSMGPLPEERIIYSFIYSLGLVCL